MQLFLKEAKLLLMRISTIRICTYIQRSIRKTQPATKTHEHKAPKIIHLYCQNKQQAKHQKKQSLAAGTAQQMIRRTITLCIENILANDSAYNYLTTVSPLHPAHL
ncbi:hypothetical protein QL285_023297 [Trifolium repens]|nr:hypothetical protein QL285_023297 [Trifolium repens]